MSEMFFITCCHSLAINGIALTEQEHSAAHSFSPKHLLLFLVIFITKIKLCNGLAVARAIM